MQWASAEILSEPLELNYFIDGLVGNVEARVGAAANGLKIDQETGAGQILKDRFFPTGKDFLTYAGKRQWFAVHSRFTDLTESEVQACQLLHLEKDIERIVRLNQHYGRLLGVTEDTSEAPAPDPNDEQQLALLQSEFRVWSCRLVSLANLAWPGTGEEDIQKRSHLLSPYLEPLQKIIAERSARAKKKKKTPSLPS